MKSGTWTTTPVSSVAGLVPPPEAVSPFRPGSVWVTARSTALGGLGAGGPLVDEQQIDVGVRRHPPQRVPDDGLRDLDLVVALVVHEDGGVARVVEELHLAGLGPDRPELLAGLEGLVDHGAVIDPLELRAHEGAALAGLDVLELDDPEDRAVDLDVGAVLELVRRNQGPGRLAVTR